LRDKRRHTAFTESLPRPPQRGVVHSEGLLNNTNRGQPCLGNDRRCGSPLDSVCRLEAQQWRTSDHDELDLSLSNQAAVLAQPLDMAVMQARENQWLVTH
jgi:hypothetical protein